MLAPVLALAMLAPLVARAQESSSPNPVANMPSEAEVGELAAKASEKVEAFQKTLVSVKPILDKADASAYAKGFDAVQSARTIIGGLKTQGRSAYALVALLATLDDLDLDPTQDSTAILLYGNQAMANTKHLPDGVSTAVISLTSAAGNLYDISELVMHATLRFVSGEEAVLSQVLKDK